MGSPMGSGEGSPDRPGKGSGKGSPEGSGKGPLNGPRDGLGDRSPLPLLKHLENRQVNVAEHVSSRKA